ncbi:MAG: flagellar hook-basal body protein [Pirellulaceae bacterium]|nr:flagellar hook-basal body protein [Pirellulaceae bacterium]
MYYGLYLSAAGANAQSQKVEVLSNNLANVDTVGFKREIALLEARDAEAIERGLARRGSRGIDDVGGGVRPLGTATEFAVGNLQSTNIPSDFALERPDEFFLVQRGNERLLTRAGNFQFDLQGRLLTQAGDPVLAADETPIQIDPELPWRALPGGVIEQFSDRFELALVKPVQTGELKKIGGNYFQSTTGEVAPVPVEERLVRNGFVEKSAVNPVQEMVELITTSRSYETNLRLIQQHDSMTSSLVGRMLKV